MNAPVFYLIAPVPAPRQVRSDKWKPRPAVIAYRAFRDQVRAVGIRIPPRVGILFELEVPASWSKRRKAETIGEPHGSTPDLDNLVKSLLDSAESSDAYVHEIHASKVWAAPGFGGFSLWELEGE